MRAHDGPAYCARFSNSGKYCITGGSDRSVKLWNPYRSEPGEEDVEGGSPLLIQTFKGPHGHPVHDVVMCVHRCGGASLSTCTLGFLFAEGCVWK